MALVFNKVTKPVEVVKVRGLGAVDITGIKDDAAIKEAIERAKKERWVDVTGGTPYQPRFLDQDIKPGTITC